MIIEFLKEEGCLQWVIEHSIAICEKAKEISKNFDVDQNIIEEASLLHDISHAIIGADIVVKQEFSKKVSNIHRKTYRTRYI